MDLDGRNFGMRAILLNGGPRKGWNTHKLLMEAERGLKEKGVETDIIHLFDLQYTDCKSCFACKLRGNKTNGVCAIHDELRPVLEKIHEAEVVIIGTPIYYGNMTGEVMQVINRMLFPVMHYENDGSRDELLPVKKKCGLIVTANATEEFINSGYNLIFENTARTIGGIFGSCETLYSCNTYQFTDYSKYYAGMFDEKQKAEHHKKQFPVDMQKAYEMGKRLVKEL